MSTFDKDIQNFGKVYGWALWNGARSWNFHSDSGCYDSLCHTESITRGNWRAVYHPTRELKNYEGNEYIITFHYKGEKITDQVVDMLIPVIQIVDGLYLQSYNDLRRVTKGKWSAPIDNATVDEVAQIVSDLTYNTDRMKMVMEIRGKRGIPANGWPRSGDSWEPRRLGVWLGYLQVPDNTSEESYYAYSEWMDDSGNIRQGVWVDQNGLPDDVSWFTHPSVDAQLIE